MIVRTGGLVTTLIVGAGLGAGAAAGCATNLLVGAEPTTGTTIAADDGVDDGQSPTTGGAADGAASDDSDTAGQDDDPDGGNSTTSTGGETGGAMDGGETDSGTTGAATGEPTGETGEGCIAQDGSESCMALEGCVWLAGKETCVPGDPCELLELAACVSEGDCVWVGNVEEGSCGGGSCGLIEVQADCDGAPTCGWDKGEPGECFELPCSELSGDICELVECELAGPKGGLQCVPNACVMGECLELNIGQCDEEDSCHFLGFEENGTCMPVGCFACPELTMSECEVAVGCDWDMGEMVCFA